MVTRTEKTRKEDDPNVSLLVRYPYRILALVLSFIIAIIAVWSSINSFDDRYWHTSDAVKMEVSIKQSLTSVKNHAILQRLSIQKESIEDKIFELEIKGPLSQYDKALYDRHKRKLEELNSKIQQKDENE